MVKVIDIEYIGEEDVYNMEVETHHNFSINGGFIVHNCDAIRYFLADRPPSSDVVINNIKHYDDDFDDDKNEDGDGFWD